MRIKGFTWFGLRPFGKPVGIFRVHEPKTPLLTRDDGAVLLYMSLPRLRLILDWNTKLHWQRRTQITVLVDRGAHLEHIINYIMYGDSGNIPQYARDFE